MPKAKCARCTWESTGIDAGFIRGLCGECSEDIRVKAIKRGIYLRVKPGESPPPAHRERRIDGLNIWWWKSSWRVEK